MEYRWVLDYRLWLLVLPIVWRCPDIVIAQTEGDTGYEYPEAYEEDYEESVLGVEPSFDVPIVNITVVAGQTAVLPCSIDALGKYKVAWLDQKNMALTFDDRRYVDDFRFAVVRPEPKEWNLQIRDVRWEDQGQYRCTINTEPGKSKSVVLHVKVPAQIVDELSSNDVRVQEGETVVLVCNVTGVPHPEVTWYRRPVTSGLHDRESKMCKPHTHGPGIGHSGEVIIIQNVSRYCDDMYECVADNGVPPAVSRQMRVTVEFAPEIVMPNKRIGQDLTRDTILECMITAYPHAQNRWMKDGMEIKSQSGKYRIQPYDDGDHTITLSLSIYDISDKDYGEYSCQASNLLGSDKESMLLFQNPTLEVQPPEKPVVGGGTYKPARPTQAVPKYTVTKDASKNNNKHNNIDKLRMEQWKIENGAPSMKGSSCSLLAAMLVAVLSSIVL